MVRILKRGGSGTRSSTRSESERTHAWVRCFMLRSPSHSLMPITDVYQLFSIRTSLCSFLRKVCKRKP